MKHGEHIEPVFTSAGARTLESLGKDGIIRRLTLKLFMTRDKHNLVKLWLVIITVKANQTAESCSAFCATRFHNLGQNEAWRWGVSMMLLLGWHSFCCVGQLYTSLGVRMNYLCMTFCRGLCNSSQGEANSAKKWILVVWKVENVGFTGMYIHGIQNWMVSHTAWLKSLNTVQYR